MNIQGVIYKIENLANGKVYIGQTRVGYEKRINEHLYGLRRNTHKNDHLQRAWNKYGEEYFEFSIVEKCKIEDLDQLEVKWIAHYRNTLVAYNCESGGNKNKVHSEYSLKKISKASREKWNDPKYAKKMRKKLTETHRGKNNVNAKRIICINTGEIFETMTEASKEYNISVNDIWKVCIGERISAGFHKNGVPLQFSYYKKDEKYKLKEIRGLHEIRKVVLTNTGEVFETAAQGAKKYNLSQGSVLSCCGGRIKSAGKLPNGEYSVWVYEDEYDSNKNYYFHRHKGSHNPRAKKIICLTTGEIFETMTEAAKKYNISSNGCKISLACTGKRKHVGRLPDGTKLAWSYYEEGKALK
ncbi:GIY-YIG nuclease family protein [Bacillus thuringiensis]|uniref:GIY-YIG nuclease family protein n=1 Tax=Bacillus thuringiensis TaxID=1428 RepID=UPI000BF2A286|nr:GIY-YIG nuclease family protein [Bacillus thuringiensis]PFA84002.1 hypothetical protein CN400_16470 [Bacillus thuringiensis]